MVKITKVKIISWTVLSLAVGYLMYYFGKIGYEMYLKKNWGRLEIEREFSKWTVNRTNKCVHVRYEPKTKNFELNNHNFGRIWALSYFVVSLNLDLRKDTIMFYHRENKDLIKINYSEQINYKVASQTAFNKFKMINLMDFILKNINYEENLKFGEICYRTKIFYNVKTSSNFVLFIPKEEEDRLASIEITKQIIEYSEKNNEKIPKEKYLRIIELLEDLKYIN